MSIICIFILQENHEKSPNSYQKFDLFEQTKAKVQGIYLIKSKFQKMENINSLKEKPLWQLTGKEFLDLIEGSSTKSNTENSENSKFTEKKYVYGISGIQSLLNCSESSAKRLKKSGAIDEAIIQNGRKIIIDVEKALELLKNNNKPGLKKR